MTLADLKRGIAAVLAGRLAPRIDWLNASPGSRALRKTICLPTENERRVTMSNIVTGRQLRAARVLARLTQKELAQAVGVHERACRFWEAKGDKAPTSTSSVLEKIESALLHHNVIVFATPTAGVRLASDVAAHRKFRD
jgi:DNA-binding XRE family transcriptional regulator